MQTYDSYKNSGIDWLGDIPSHWEVAYCRYYLNTLTDYTANGSFGDLAKNVKYLDYPSYSRLIRLTDLRYNLNNKGVYVDERSHKYLKKSELFGGEVLIANVGAYAGFVVKMPQINFCATLGPNMFLTKWNNSNISDNFLVYLLNSIRYKSYLSIIANSAAQPKLNKDNIRGIKILIPQLSEQEAIAAFLDEKCGKIDELVSVKEQQIALFKERRQVVIHEAVTKGIQPNVEMPALSGAEMKDSGIDWIGKIPSHWEVKRLKNIGNAIIGLTYSPNDLCNSNEGTLILRSSNLQNNGIEYNDNVYVKTSITDKLKLRIGDIVICSRNGSRDLIGKCGIVKEKDLGNSFGAFTTVFRSNINNFLFQILSSGIFKSYSGRFLTSTINQLTIGNLNSFEVPIPPITEQEAIIAYLEEQTGKIDQAIALKTEQIAKLKAYKQSLINEVVTGKVKVA